MSTNILVSNISGVIDFYLTCISTTLYSVISSSFRDIEIYHGSTESYTRNLEHISRELLDDQLKIEEEKIKQKFKHYDLTVMSLFKGYIIMLTFGYKNKLLDERYYDFINVSMFTKSCIQKYAIAEKSIESMKAVIKETVTECLSIKYITTYFISLPVSKDECYKISQSKIKNTFSNICQ